MGNPGEFFNDPFRVWFLDFGIIDTNWAKGNEDQDNGFYVVFDIGAHHRTAAPAALNVAVITPLPISFGEPVIPKKSVKPKRQRNPKLRHPRKLRHSKKRRV